MARDRGQGRPRRGRGSGGSFGGGRTNGAPRNRGPHGLHARPSSHSIAKSFRKTNNLPWMKSLMDDGLRAAGSSSGLDNGTKIFVSNLDTQVSNEDIRELFSEMGELIRYALHYDKYGRTSGSAEVVYARRSDALKAFNRYNNVTLDGRPMKIELDDNRAKFPLSARMNVGGGANGSNVLMIPARGPARTRGGVAAMQGYGQRGSGRKRNRRGQRRGRGGKKGIVKSADELDMELDNHRATAL